MLFRSYAKHELLAIALNSVSKWRARCLPSFLGYIEKTGELPKHLAFSIAALMAFYTGQEMKDKALIGNRDGEEYKILDDQSVLQFFAENSQKETTEFVRLFIGNEEFFGQDLTKVEGVVEAVSKYLEEIRGLGMRKAMENNFSK